MSRSITRASADLQRLLNEGYELEIREGYLLIHHVPYVTPERRVESGSLVSTLQLAGEETVAPDQHEAYFVGQLPCDAEGTPLTAIINSSSHQELAPGVEVDHFLSSKPTDSGRYTDYWQKMTTYVTIISAPALAIDESVTARTYPLLTDPEEDPIFNYTDTASPRAGIAAVTERLRIGPVGIIGVGGTGAYLLDFLAKAPIAEIHLYDADRFIQHNAFRAPGAASREELAAGVQKVDYLRARYEPMRRGIVAHDEYLDDSNLDQLDDMVFVFLSLDESGAKRAIVDHLEAAGIAFIDVGMGIEVIEGELRGMVQTVISTPEARDHLRRRVSLEDPALGDDYDQNIQIAELNALNAALAVIRFKKHFGFYADVTGEGTSIYVLESNKLLAEDSG
jgi:hypothetical protein